MTPIIADPEKYGYNFIGWDKEYKPGVDFPEDDITYTAQWEVKEGVKIIKATFNYGDGNPLNNTIDTVADAMIVDFPTVNPSKPGYLFVGWYDENGKYYNKSTNAPSEDFILTAEFAKIPDTAYGLSEDFESKSISYVNVNAFGGISGLMNENAQIAAGNSAGEGKYSILLKNADYAKSDSKKRPAAALLNSDGTPFIVKKGARYRISFSTLSLGVNGEDLGRSYIVPVVSAELAENVGSDSAQNIYQKVAVRLESEYSSASIIFEASRDGFVYLTMFTRGSAGEANGRNHMVSVDDVNLEVVSNSVKVEFWYKNKDNADRREAIVYGVPGEKLDYVPSPKLSGYEFGGWFTSETFSERADVFPSADTKYWAKLTKADYTEAETLQGSFSFGFGDNDGEDEDSIDLFYQSKNNSRLKSDMETYEYEVVHNDSENAHSGSSYMKVNYVPNIHTTPDSGGWERETYMLIYNPDGKYNKTWLAPNTSYKLSFWYKADNDFEVNGFYINFVDPNDISTPLTGASTVLSMNTTKVKGKEWIKLEKVITTPADKGVTCLRLSVFLSSIEDNACGNVYNGYIDDIAVERLNTYAVSFEMNGGDNMESVKIASGEVIGKLSENPFRIGYTFEGFYTDKELKKPFDIEKDTITGNIILYAKWSVKKEDNSEIDSEDPIDNSNDSDDNNDNSSTDDNWWINNDDPHQDTDVVEPVDYGPRLIIKDASTIERKTVDNNVTENDFSWAVVFICIGSAVVIAGGIMVVLIIFKKKKTKERGSRQ